MTYESSADAHRKLAERAIPEANVKAAKEAVLVAKANLIKAEAELAEHLKKENS